MCYKYEGKYPKKWLKESKIVTSGGKSSANTVGCCYKLTDLLDFLNHIL